MMQPSTIAKKLKTLERKVRANEPELKVHYDSGNSSILPNVLIGEFLTEIAQGTTDSTRIGTRIKVQSIEIRGYSAMPMDIYMVKTVDDKDAPGLSDFNSGLAGAFGNHTKLKTILQSNAGNLGCNRVSDTTTNVFPFLLKKKWPNGLVVEFDAATGAYGDCVRNSLWFIAMNQMVGSGTQPIYFNIKTEFTDA